VPFQVLNKQYTFTNGKERKPPILKTKSFTVVILGAAAHWELIFHAPAYTESSLLILMGVAVTIGQVYTI
jgi:hypothetical protein